MGLFAKTMSVHTAANAAGQRSKDLDRLNPGKPEHGGGTADRADRLNIPTYIQAYTLRLGRGCVYIHGRTWTNSTRTSIRIPVPAQYGCKQLGGDFGRWSSFCCCRWPWLSLSVCLFCCGGVWRSSLRGSTVWWFLLLLLPWLLISVCFAVGGGVWRSSFRGSPNKQLTATQRGRLLTAQPQNLVSPEQTREGTSRSH